MSTTTAPARSPWGAVQYSSPIGTDGIFMVSTAGHGGIKVPAALNRRVHEAWRQAGGWYEEDCEWAIVALTFPELFAGHIEAAESSARNYFPDEYTAATGKAVPVAESYTLRKRAFEASTADAFVVTSAFGDWHEAVPAGMVGVVARRKSDDARATFLLPEEDYQTRGEDGFVIDEARHTRADIAF
jgi:hypothetical protein